MRAAVIVLCTQWFAEAAEAQDFLITQDTITTCAGMLYDSGGPGFVYGILENHVSVVCPDQPGQRVVLDFLSFNLSPQFDSPIDRLSIFDGPSIAAPLLGEYEEQDLLGTVILPSLLNASGCLTLQFQSNANGPGNFAATISCAQQCELPSASFTAMGDTMLLCFGDALVVDGSVSMPTGPQALASWAWINSTTGQTETSSNAMDTLSFSQVGINRIRLQVADSAGCASVLSDEFIAVVLPPASFEGTFTSDPYACLGDTVTLTGAASLDSLVMHQSTGAVYPGGFYLPDDVNVPNVLTINVSSFPDSAVVDETSDLSSVCVNMEHSFLADLVISLTCPNGTSISLHQQGGSVYIGGAMDGISGPPLIGDCWQYCWTYPADFGTFSQSAGYGSSNLVLAGSPPNSTLIPGTYTPVQPISNLIGCPMNGTWTLTITDLWAQDDGFLCSWALSLGQSPQLDSLLITTYPTIQLSNPDSAFWNGPGLLPPMTAQQSIAIPGGLGEFPYTLTVIDSEGCVHDTTLIITVIDSPFLVDAGPDVSLCDGPTTLEGSVFNSADTCTYTLILFETFGDGWGGGANLSVSIAGSTVNYSITDLGVAVDTILLPVATGDAISLFYTAGTIWNNENRFTLLNSVGDAVYESPQGPPSGTAYQGLAACIGSPASPFISWTPALGLGDTTSAVTSVSPPAAGWYVLTVSLAGGACMASDSVFVLGSSVTASIAYSAANSTLCMEPAGFISYQWYLAGALYATTAGNCLQNPPFGIWTAIGVTGGECDAYAQAVAICPDLALTYANGNLSVQAGLGTYTWTLNGQALPNAIGPVITPTNIGTYSVTVTMAGGCVVSASIQLDSLIGIEEHDGAQAGLRIVPNPSRGEFVLGLPEVSHGTLRITILDATGRVADERSVNVAAKQRHVPLSLSLASGAYSIGVRSAEKQFFTRFTIE
ncbi:MAG: hypothetical protein IPM12_16475 [Flavobacteriales bacterium]|nr:hypothetical protein [Flavobacteriales bacterium]